MQPFFVFVLCKNKINFFSKCTIYIFLKSGSAETEFKSEFQSGGMNQTIHNLSLSITTDITVLIPPASENTSVSTDVVIAETVIVGEVPDYALYRSGITQ